MPRLAPREHHYGLPEHIEDCLESSSPIRCVAFNPFGTLLAGGCAGGEIVLWSWETRTLVKTLAGGHDKEITTLSWNESSCQLLSTCQGGRLVLWDILGGAMVAHWACSEGAIRHVSFLPMQEHKEQDRKRGYPCDMRHSHLLISFQKSAAHHHVWAASATAARKEVDENSSVDDDTVMQTRDSSPLCNAQKMPSRIPCIAFNSDSKNPKLLHGEAASATGQVAIFGSSHAKSCIDVGQRCRNEHIVFSAAKGTISLLRWPHMDFIDAVRLQGSPSIVKLELDDNGNHLLLTGTDNYVRIFKVEWEIIRSLLSADDGDILFNEDESHMPKRKSRIPLMTSDEIRMKLDGCKAPMEGSLVRYKASSCLKLIRRFSAGIEDLGWGACAFSPDSQHVISSLADPEEQIIYIWNLIHGFPESMLQGIKDGIISLCLHPDIAPMQLIAVGRTGRVYVWTKILSQPWSAFAPDFEVLEENREYVELETDFDLESVDSDAELEKEKEKLRMEEDEKIDVLKSREFPGISFMASNIVCDSSIPVQDEEISRKRLFHLPMTSSAQVLNDI